MESEFSFIRELRENNSIIVYIMWKYVAIFLVLAFIGNIYDKYKKRVQQSENLEHSDIVKKYLLNDDALTGQKPIVWVYIDYETNSRNWESFGSRNTNNFNQPYQLITLQSIIKQSGDEFNVCLIDENSFSKLLPNWTINLKKLSSPIKCYMRDMAIMNLLYAYGGMVVPSSYLALKHLSGLYDTGLERHDCFIMQTKNTNSSSTFIPAFPNKLFMGCKKHSETMKELISFVEILNSKDVTYEQKFLGEVDRKCLELINKDKMTMLDGRLIGAFTNGGKQVLVDDLLQESYIDFNENLQGILIPDKDILKRVKYQWFARMSPDQIMESNLILSKYLLLSL